MRQGAQPPARAISLDGITDFSARREAVTEKGGCVGLRRRREHLNDEARCHPFFAALRRSQKFGPTTKDDEMWQIRTALRLGQAQAERR